jgi:hypothetical protein
MPQVTYKTAAGADALKQTLIASGVKVGCPSRWAKNGPNKVGERQRKSQEFAENIYITLYIHTTEQ